MSFTDSAIPVIVTLLGLGFLGFIIHFAFFSGERESDRKKMRGFVGMILGSAGAVISNSWSGSPGAEWAQTLQLVSIGLIIFCGLYMLNVEDSPPLP